MAMMLAVALSQFIGKRNSIDENDMSADVCRISDMPWKIVREKRKSRAEFLKCKSSC